MVRLVLLAAAWNGMSIGAAEPDVVEVVASSRLEPCLMVGGVLGADAAALPKPEPSSTEDSALGAGEWALGTGDDAPGAGVRTPGTSNEGAPGGVPATTALGPMGKVEISSLFKKSKVVGSKGEVDISEKGN